MKQKSHKPEEVICQLRAHDTSGTSREHFEKTLAEVVENSGWILYAWVLMSNYYRFLSKTSGAHPVQGMIWFQNTWARRFNSRHRLRDHLFGGRHKAIPVEEGNSLTRLINHVHLNPVRAGFVRRRDALESHPWCALPDHVEPLRKRRGWMATEPYSSTTRIV